MSKIDRKYIEKLKQLQTSTDTEDAHSQADDVLCDLLVELTYTDIVAEWKKIDKWYA